MQNAAEQKGKYAKKCLFSSFIYLHIEYWWDMSCNLKWDKCTLMDYDCHYSLIGNHTVYYSSINCYINQQ